MSNYRPIQEGELHAGNAVQYFDNIYDENGKKLVKSAKRRWLKEKMLQLFYVFSDKNKCILKDGQTVEIIVCRKNEGRAAFCYFNNVEAPQDEILQAFANVMGITYIKEKSSAKTNGQIIAQKALVYFDNILEEGKKLTDSEKLCKLHKLFADLYHDKEKNKFITASGEFPIIVKCRSANNKEIFCLNIENDLHGVMQAFTAWAGCRYRTERENWVDPLEKNPHELTARECIKILYGIPSVDEEHYDRHTSTRLVEWFYKIGEDKQQNRVVLPNGEVHPMLVYRQSGSQFCWCLNTSDEYIKPFVIRQAAETIGATIKVDNIKINKISNKELYTLQKDLQRAELVALSQQDKEFYKSYLQKIGKIINVQKKQKQPIVAKEK